MMDRGISAVLDAYHEMIRRERAQPRAMPEGGRDGGQDRRTRAVGQGIEVSRSKEGVSNE